MKVIKLVLVLAIILGSFGIEAQKKELTLDVAVMQQYRDLYPDRLAQLQWIGDTDNYSYVEDDVLMRGNAKTEKALLSLETLNEKGGLDTNTNGLKRFPRITWNSATSFWYKNGSGYYTYDLKKKKGSQLMAFSEEAASRDYHVKSNRLAYTIDNNLYIQNQAQEDFIQVTDNPEEITSGAGYARQEFGITKGTFWSVDGSKLAFYQKDESNVTNYPLVEYNSKPATVRNQRYPMAGQAGEIPSIGIYSVASGKTIFLDLENGKKDDSFYGTNFAWGPNGKFVYVAIVNRDQNHVWLKKYDAITGTEIATLFEEKDDKWVEPEHPVLFLKNNPNEFLWISEMEGFDNLYHYNTEGKLLGKTKFNFPITRFIGFNEAGNKVYVEATSEIASESHGYVIDLNDFSTKKITKEAGSHRITPSASGKMILDSWSSVDVPHKTDIITEGGKKGKNLITADDPMIEYQWNKPELFTMESFDGTNLYCRMIKPSNFDPNKKYPVLVYTYNGSHVQLVKNRWLGGASLWMNSLAEEGYIVFTVDGRGSSNRGKDFERATFRRLGYLETKDQEFCAQWLKAQDFTDENRFAIHGWSFGGYMTNNLMLRTPGLFQVGVAGGPVIDWSLYEIMYTERYMDTPQTNEKGFEQTDMTKYVSNLEGKLLEIHGAIDDVVVPQHSMKMLKAAVDAGVQIDFFTYPGHPHNVRGKDRVHLMEKVLDYVKENLEVAE